MACILRRKTKNGVRYIGKVYDPRTGRNFYTRSWVRRKDAEKELQQIQYRLRLGEDPKPRVVPFREYVGEFRGSINHLAESTQADYGYTCDRLVDFFGDTPMTSITTVDCEKHLADMVAKGCSPYTVRKSLTRLRQIMRRAVRDGIITVSPADDVTNKPRGDLRQKEIVVLDKDQIVQFIDLAPDDAKALFTLWFAIGARFGEIAGLTWSEAVDWDKSQILIRAQVQDGKLLTKLKSKTSRRSIPVSKGVLDVLRAYREVCPPSDLNLVFPTVNGKPLHRSNIHRLFKPIVEQMELGRFTPHCIRHTFATVLLSEGVNPKLVATLLGHSPGSGDLIMSTYGHLLPCDAGRAAETMGDILIREEGPAGYVVYADFNRWSEGSESSNMYGRRRA